jgi:hypothetical protein
MPFKIVSDSGPQFVSEDVENLLACLVMKHMFTITYKLDTNGLV